jgi:hypothetical protein
MLPCRFSTHLLYLPIYGVLRTVPPYVQRRIAEAVAHPPIYPHFALPTLCHTHPGHPTNMYLQGPSGLTNGRTGNTNWKKKERQTCTKYYVNIPSANCRVL